MPNERVVMGTGFGPPGIVLLDILFKVTRDISVFYIDTGFLFDQTYDLKGKLQKKYGFGGWKSVCVFLVPELKFLVLGFDEGWFLWKTQNFENS